MDRKEDIIKGLKIFLAKVNKDLKVEEIVFFGSRTTNTAKEESDIDLIIVSKDFEGLNFIKRAAIMYKYWELDYAVDFLCYTPKEYIALKKRVSVVQQALKEGIVIK